MELADAYMSFVRDIRQGAPGVAATVLPQLRRFLGHFRKGGCGSILKDTRTRRSRVECEG